MSKFSLEDNVFLKTVLSSYNVLVHILLGMIVGISLLFAVKMDYNEPSVPEDIILLHILLCVPGYTLLMSQSIMSMTSYNTWSSNLSRVNRRRAHWILQIVGSSLGLIGSIIIMSKKDINFDTLHGKFGLVTLVFTTVSLLTGVPTLFSHKIPRVIPRTVARITHIVLGIVAYTSAFACLCLAFDKEIFRIWTNNSVSLGLISITGIFVLIILINPLVNISQKLVKIIKYRSEN